MSIVTITFNPSLDRSASVAALIPEKKLACTNLKFDPGGGGINVARALKRLGIHDVIAVFPQGGCNGNALTELLRKENIIVKPISAEKETRENIIIFEEKNKEQYRFGMPGASLSKTEWETCLNEVKNIPKIDYLVASGSLPDGVPSNIFAQIAKIAKEKNARFIIDTSGTPLKYAIQEGVFLIKPNVNELSALVNHTHISIEDIEKYALQLIETSQCENIVVSMGADGAILVNKNLSIRIKAPSVKKLSTVGAGDSMVAGIVGSLYRGFDTKYALMYGIACGTAATMNAGTELFHQKDVNQLISMMQIG